MPYRDDEQANAGARIAELERALAQEQEKNRALREDLALATSGQAAATPGALPMSVVRARLQRPRWMVLSGLLALPASFGLAVLAGLVDPALGVIVLLLGLGVIIVLGIALAPKCPACKRRLSAQGRALLLRMGQCPICLCRFRHD